MGLREKKEVQAREKIFKVALRRFCEKSIEGTKLKDIAEEAEVSHARIPEVCSRLGRRHSPP